MKQHKGYPAHKDSGIEWLGAIPSHWAVKRLKYNLSLTSEKTGSRERAVALENIESWTGRFIETNTEFEGEGVAFKANDILFGKLRPYLAKAYLADFSGEAVGDFFVIRPASTIYPRFAQYQVLTREFIDTVDGSTYGAKMPRVSRDFFGDMPLVIPPIDEQIAIASFLDRQTKLIDFLITKKARFIELLSEKRQALITHVVTKGLHGNTKMKSSGVEWLGEIPENWDLTPLKFVTPSLTVGIVVNPSNYVAEEGLPFIYGGDISEGRIHFESSRRITKEHSEQNSKTMLQAGDLLTVRVGAPGVTAVVSQECEGGNCASVMHIRRGNFDSDWLCYVMNSRVVRYQVEVVQYGAAQEQFNISHAVDFLVPKPTLAEQREIADFLNHETLRLDVLSKKTERSIELLKEYRSALITAAVTGQIDVRGEGNGQDLLIDPLVSEASEDSV